MHKKPLYQDTPGSVKRSGIKARLSGRNTHSCRLIQPTLSVFGCHRTRNGGTSSGCLSSCWWNGVSRHLSRGHMTLLLHYGAISCSTARWEGRTTSSSFLSSPSPLADHREIMITTVRLLVEGQGRNLHAFSLRQEGDEGV